MRPSNDDTPEEAPAGASSRENPPKAQWKNLFAFATRRQLPLLIFAIATSVVAGAVVPVEAFLYGKIFSYFAAFAGGAITKEVFMHSVDKYAIYLLVLGSSGWFVQAGFFCFWTAFGAFQAGVARDRLFNGMLKRELSWFDMRRHGIGALLTRLNMYIEELQTATSLHFGLTITYTANTLLSIGMSMYFSWDLTLVTLASVLITAVAVAIFSKRIQPNIEAQAERLGEAAKHVLNAFSSIECVKCFNGQDFEFSRYYNILVEAAKYYNRQIYWNSAQGAFLRMSTLGMFVQGFWYGSHLVTAGKKSPSSILTCFWAVMMATQAFMQILPFVIVLEKGRLAGAKE